MNNRTFNHTFIHYLDIEPFNPKHYFIVRGDQGRNIVFLSTFTALHYLSYGIREKCVYLVKNDARRIMPTEEEVLGIDWTDPPYNIVLLKPEYIKDCVSYMRLIDSVISIQQGRIAGGFNLRAHPAFSALKQLWSQLNGEDDEAYEEFLERLTAYANRPYEKPMDRYKFLKQETHDLGQWIMLANMIASI